VVDDEESDDGGLIVAYRNKLRKQRISTALLSGFGIVYAELCCVLVILVLSII